LIIGLFGLSGAFAQILLNQPGAMLYGGWSPQVVFALAGILKFAPVVLRLVMRPLSENKEQGEKMISEN
jgi:hypothetical protein